MHDETTKELQDMHDGKNDGTKPGIGARLTRGLGTFNIAYGILGLACAALLRFALPAGSVMLPDSLLIASTVASASAIVQGVLLRVYGPAALSYVGRAFRWVRGRLSGLQA